MRTISTQLFKFTLCLCILVTHHLAKGQATLNGANNGKYAIIGLGADSYSGDLSGYEKWGSSFRLGVKFNRHKKFNGNIFLNIGSVIGQDPFYIYTGNDSNNSTPNNFSKTSFTSIRYEWQYNLIDKQRWKIYVGQGIGLLFFTPKDEFNNKLFDQNNTRAQNEVYGSISPLLPSSLGFRYIFKNEMAIEQKTTIGNTLTDYLDNISDWGNKGGGDNILSIQLFILVPIK